MKRANLVLDGEVLEAARRIFGTKTYSDTVNKVLAEAVRQHKARSIIEFMGKGLWQGDLLEMRRDAPPPRKKRKKARA